MEEKKEVIELKDIEDVVDLEFDSKTSNALGLHDTDFGVAMQRVQGAILKKASTEDGTFVETLKKNIKDAATLATQKEKDIAKLNINKVAAEDEKLDTERAQNEYKQAEDKWDNIKKARQVRYDGVKPILEFVGIESPLNLVLTYLLLVVLTPLYIISKIFKGTIGVILSGATDSTRSKAVKGFLWTLLGALSVAALSALVYLFLLWQNII